MIVVLLALFSFSLRLAQPSIVIIALLLLISSSKLAFGDLFVIAFAGLFSTQAASKPPTIAYISLANTCRVTRLHLADCQ